MPGNTGIDTENDCSQIYENKKRLFDEKQPFSITECYTLFFFDSDHRQRFFMDQLVQPGNIFVHYLLQPV